MGTKREPNKEDAPYRPYGPGHPDWVPPPKIPKNPKLVKAAFKKAFKG